MLEEEVKEEKKELIEYNCSKCNSKFYTNNLFNKCIFCDNENLEKEDASLDKSIKIIPFKLDYKDAINDYKKKSKFNFLVPFIFKSKKNIRYLNKIYVPVNITNINCEGEVEFYGSEKSDINTTDDKKYEVVQQVKLNYEDVLLKTTSKIDSNLFDKVSDYSLLDIMDIDSSYFSDCCYLYEDNTSVLDKENISKYCLKLVKDNVNHSMKKLKSDKTSINFENTRKVLVPIYLLNVVYKGKDYTYIMNGQNGKSYINLPIGKFETILFSSLLFILIFLISFLISYFL